MTESAPRSNESSLENPISVVTMTYPIVTTTIQDSINPSQDVVAGEDDDSTLPPWLFSNAPKRKKQTVSPEDFDFSQLVVVKPKSTKKAKNLSRVKPYQQSTLKRSGAKKLKPCYYGPFRVIRRVGEVDYELELPIDSKVHNVFHVSHLKRALGYNVAPLAELPPLDDEGKIILVLKAIPDIREHTLRTQVIIEYLVKWKNLLVEDATWEGKNILKNPYK
ncbi:uncharacterized protein LOC131870090 [Cryptomeria japonica]|uniref:uncharacterized protein LOC131870090 n=1 Tax=Cryptomeria japonica TaxID=3369 RepID=UPI0027DA46EB|nr:uncharacterized protein LOC131870090 [Cryptomeria japonica]